MVQSASTLCPNPACLCVWGGKENFRSQEAWGEQLPDLFQRPCQSPIISDKGAVWSAPFDRESETAGFQNGLVHSVFTQISWQGFEVELPGAFVEENTRLQESDYRQHDCERQNEPSEKLRTAVVHWRPIFADRSSCKKEIGDGRKGAHAQVPFHQPAIWIPRIPDKTRDVTSKGTRVGQLIQKLPKQLTAGWINGFFRRVIVIVVVICVFCSSLWSWLDLGLWSLNLFLASSWLLRRSLPFGWFGLVWLRLFFLFLLLLLFLRLL